MIENTKNLQWTGFLDALTSRPRMYLIDERLESVAAALEGFQAASNDQLLRNFQVAKSLEHQGHGEEAYWMLILRELGLEVSHPGELAEGDSGRAGAYLLSNLAEYLRNQ